MILLKMTMMMKKNLLMMKKNLVMMTRVLMSLVCLVTTMEMVIILLTLVFTNASYTFWVEACILIEAGTSVSNKRTTTATIRNQMMLDRYVNLVCMFSPDDFVSPTTQEDMSIRLFHGKKGGYNGEKLWRKFKEYRKEIRTRYTLKLPKEIPSFPSGHSLRDIYKKFALECYKVEYDVSLISCRL